MSYRILLPFLFILPFNAFAQITFEAGYFIDNEGQKTACLIKNVEWKNNPVEFQYKLNENSEIKTDQIENVKEFGIGSNTKYCRFKVAIDRSTDNVKDLSYDKKADFQEETLFLRTLIEGAATLYHYEDGSLNRYFYKVNDAEVTQLVYKRYLISTANLGQNNRYRQQLTNDLKCTGLMSVNKLEYQKTPLQNFFVKYNECVQADFTVYNKRKKGEVFKLLIKPGLRLNSLDLGNGANPKDVEFNNDLGFSLGISTEFILPFNRNKWAVILEPTFQYFKSEQKSEGIVGLNDLTTVDYKSIELPVGIRHYFFLNPDSRLFINGFFVFDFPLTSKVNYYRFNTEFENFTPLNNFAFGFGYTYKSKYSAELRYSTKRNILNDYVSWTGDFYGFTFVFGYRIL